MVLYKTKKDVIKNINDIAYKYIKLPWMFGLYREYINKIDNAQNVDELKNKDNIIKSRTEILSHNNNIAQKYVEDLKIKESTIQKYLEKIEQESGNPFYNENISKKKKKLNNTNSNSSMNTNTNTNTTELEYEIDF